MREQLQQRRETGLGKLVCALPGHDLNSLHPTSEQMKRLIGSTLVDQHIGKSWTIFIPAGQSSESAEFAISLGRFTLNVTEQVVFVRPTCDKWFE